MPGYSRRRYQGRCGSNHARAIEYPDGTARDGNGAAAGVRAGHPRFGPGEGHAVRLETVRRVQPVAAIRIPANASCRAHSPNSSTRVPAMRELEQVLVLFVAAVM